MNIKNLCTIDKAYLENISKLPEIVRDNMDEVINYYTFDLGTTELSEAICNRMKTFYQSQTQIKYLLGKQIQTAGADFFVETILYFTKLYCKKNYSGIQVISEKEILIRVEEINGKRKRIVIRPDIAFYKGNTLLAIIECKTQLGRARGHWEELYKEREALVNSKFDNVPIYLLSLTSDNWSGFGDHQEVGNKYFCLLNNIWPVSYYSPNQILNRIEDLFLKVELNFK